MTFSLGDTVSAASSANSGRCAAQGPTGSGSCGRDANCDSGVFIFTVCKHINTKVFVNDRCTTQLLDQLDLFRKLQNFVCGQADAIWEADLDRDLRLCGGIEKWCWSPVILLAVNVSLGVLRPRCSSVVLHHAAVGQSVAAVK